MTRACAAAVIACAAIAAVPALAQSPRAQEIADADERAWQNFDTWLGAITRHAPGSNDASIQAMLGLRAPDIESAIPHMVATLREVFRLQERRADMDALFQRHGRRSFSSDAGRKALRVRVDRVMAAGTTTRFLKRAAILHADIALASPTAHLTLREGSGYLLNDGRGAGDEGRPWHWMLGRSFLHLVPNAARDRDVRIWYQVVGNHLWSMRSFTESAPHLRDALDLLPRDAEIQFLRGVVHEALGAPHIQAAVEAQKEAIQRMVGSAMKASSSVRSRDAENGEAREAFGKALDADPNHHEARIRLARLLTIDGSHARAAGELRTALAAPLEPRQRYFAQLFLGRAEEQRGRFAAARVAYEAASALYPHAQSPRLALSQLALRAGDRDGGMAVFTTLSEAAAPESDPWWWYHFEREPHRTVWISRMWDTFREVVR